MVDVRAQGSRTSSSFSIAPALMQGTRSTRRRAARHHLVVNSRILFIALATFNPS